MLLSTGSLKETRSTPASRSSKSNLLTLGGVASTTNDVTLSASFSGIAVAGLPAMPDTGSNTDVSRTSSSVMDMYVLCAEEARSLADLILIRSDSLICI